MKIITKSLFAIGIIGMTFSFEANAETYTTLRDGDWNNEVAVWSMDGETECGCYPGIITADDSIFIQHNINLTSDLEFSSDTYLHISSEASLSGLFSIMMSSIAADIEGYLNVKNLTTRLFATVNVTAELLQCSGEMEVGGRFNLRGTEVAILNGNLTVTNSALLTSSNSAKVHVSNGNIENSGVIDICGGCCFIASDDWINYFTGSVKGSGAAITTTGNMINDGNWNIDIVWCSADKDDGMVVPEDCDNAFDICAISELPVELMSFDAKKVGEQTAKITWQTASEYNSDYFVLQKSTDAENWIDFESLEAAGNSNTLLNYYAIDRSLEFGMTYYRLMQVDNDGTTYYSDIVVVDNKPEIDLRIFPNPVKKGESITLTNLAPMNGTIRIINNIGQTIYVEEKDNKREFVRIETDELSPGVFILIVEQGSTKVTSRIVIQE